MKKTIAVFLGLFFCAFLFAQDSIRVSLAEWTFDKWYGGGILPPGQTTDKPIQADRGTLAKTAKIGTEQMFFGGSASRSWKVPTTGGYVQCSTGWSGSEERYYMISGLNSIDASSLSITSSHSTSQTVDAYSFKVQYRLSSTGPWKDVFGPFSVNDVTESGISRRQVNNVRLPNECNNIQYLDIRWVCTAFPTSPTTQFRIDNIYLTASKRNPNPTIDKTLLIEAQALHENDWAIPSWTLLLSARKKATETPTATNLKALSIVMKSMLSKEEPYCINCSFNGDPTTNMGFAWYTNSGTNGGQVQIVAGKNAKLSDFESPLMTNVATTTNLSNVNYLVPANDPTFTADLSANIKRNYTSNKVLVSGLKPNTNYSYRVGKQGAWSSVRTFHTAKNTKEDFSFIYITDTQANSADNFDVSTQILEKAYSKTSNPLFVLATGDLVESQGSMNSEWEYEQFFERIENVWSKLPIVSTIGNHDASSSNNFFNHINNDDSYNQSAAVKTTMSGTVYSFVVGDALFMVVNHEDVSKPGYLTSLGEWLTKQVNANVNVRWRIVCVHTGLFSGGSHQKDMSSIALRDAMLPYYQKLKIDLLIHGHDHVYSTIGPVDYQSKTLVPNSVHNVNSLPIVEQANMNGKSGGTFDVSNGTFYFSNNSASRKKYAPSTKTKMDENSAKIGIPDYWSLFTGRFSQTGEPTYSNIRVTTNAIYISTFAINNSGKTYLFDKIKVIK